MTKTLSMQRIYKNKKKNVNEEGFHVRKERGTRAIYNNYEHFSHSQGLLKSLHQLR